MGETKAQHAQAAPGYTPAECRGWDRRALTLDQAAVSDPCRLQGNSPLLGTHKARWWDLGQDGLPAHLPRAGGWALEPCPSQPSPRGLGILEEHLCYAQKQVPRSPVSTRRGTSCLEAQGHPRSSLQSRGKPRPRAGMELNPPPGSRPQVPLTPTPRSMSSRCPGQQLVLRVHRLIHPVRAPRVSGGPYQQCAVA